MVFKLQCSKVDYIETETQLKTTKFQVLKTTFCWYVWALFDHVRHWISSWPLNKVCYSWQQLQLLFRSQSHANTLSYCSTLVKLASWKWHFKWNQHLSWQLSYMNLSHKFSHITIFRMTFWCSSVSKKWTNRLELLKVKPIYWNQI